MIHLHTLQKALHLSALHHVVELEVFGGGEAQEAGEEEGAEE